MALNGSQIKKCMTILFPTPLRVTNRPATVTEEEALAVLAAVDADTQALLLPILEAWDGVWLDESSITANTANKGFSTSGNRARKLIRQQLVSVLSYDPLHNGSGSMVGRG